MSRLRRRLRGGVDEGGGGGGAGEFRLPREARARDLTAAARRVVCSANRASATTASATAASARARRATAGCVARDLPAYSAPRSRPPPVASSARRTGRRRRRPRPRSRRRAREVGPAARRRAIFPRSMREIAIDARLRRPPDVSVMVGAFQSGRLWPRGEIVRGHQGAARRPASPTSCAK